MGVNKLSTPPTFQKPITSKESAQAELGKARENAKLYANDPTRGALWNARVVELEIELGIKTEQPAAPASTRHEIEAKLDSARTNAQKYANDPVRGDLWASQVAALEAQLQQM
jgi:hypothetical protein